MYKIAKRFSSFSFTLSLLALFFIFFVECIQEIYAQETITLTTYYPAPYGVYNELSTNKLITSVALAVPSEYGAMQDGDVHIGRSLIVGQGAGTGFAYDELAAPPSPGDIITQRSLAIGTTSHATDGGMLSAGTFNVGSDLAITGPGTRFIWYPKKAALRAGMIDMGNPTYLGTEWDNINIGLYSVALGVGTIASNQWANAFGFRSRASGWSSTAMGYNTLASGFYSTAMGSGSTASAFWSTAMGYYTTASGNWSTAMGRNTTASQTYSTAMGVFTTASGMSSTALGYYATAQAYNSLVLGRYNVISGNPTLWVATDPLFVIGNGSSSAAPSNAVTVLKNGNVGIETATPTTKLHIASSNPILKITDTTTADDGAYLWLQESDAFGVKLRYNSSSNTFFWLDTVDAGVTTTRLVVHRNGNVGIGTTNPLGTLDVNGTIFQRGGILHPDYVFEDDYELESIEEHSEYMWNHKHLKALPKAKKDEAGNEVVDLGQQSRGILEELEKAHIYIVQLNDQLKEQQKQIDELKVQIDLRQQ